MQTLRRLATGQLAPARSLVCAVALALVAWPASSQVRRTDQDDSLDNLRHPEGYVTAEPGTLGRVTSHGSGPRAMVLVAGYGFGGDIFDAFMERHADDFTMYAVTLAGFGGTPALPNPPEGTSFGEQTWTSVAVDGVAALIDTEELTDVVLVGHWLGGTQVSLRVALQRPDDVAAVVLLGGAAKFAAANPEMMPPLPNVEARVMMVDAYMAPTWFKTVTRDTWDDNNFLPGDYAQHPVRALQLWRQAAAPPLHVWVPYLCEFNAQDVTAELADLAVPTLLLVPGFDEGHWTVEGMDYMKAYTRSSWDGVAEANELFEIETIEDTRLFMTEDQPAAVDAAVAAFLARH